MSLYTFVNDLDKQTLYLYVFIFVVVMTIFIRISITLTTIFGVFLWVCIVLYINEGKELDLVNVNNSYKTKLDNIQPSPKNFTEHREIIDFYFSIQDFYIYNPQAYEEMIEQTDIFLQIYNDIKITPDSSNKLYETMYNTKRNIVNCLHSMIFKLYADKAVIAKLDNAMMTLDTILTKYLNEVHYLHSENLYLNGYNINHKQINTGPLEFNNFSDNINKLKYTYDFF